MFKLPELLKSKWLLTDALIVFDVLENVFDSTSYDAVAGWLGIEPALINSITSLIELARFLILAHEAKSGARK